MTVRDAHAPGEAAAGGTPMDGNVVVITGASAGIGAAVAVEVASRGMRPVLVARREAELRSVADRCPGEFMVIPADVTRRHEVRGVVDAVLDHFGRIDVWINNVGRGITRQPSELTDDDIDLIMRTNVMSALYGMQEVLPHFRERGSGHVVNVSSLLGRIPFATFRSAYCGAKHFLNALTATFRAEVQETHPEIRVSLVSPGVVRTDFGLNALHGGPDSRELPWSQSPEEVAAVIADVLETGEPDVYTREGSQKRIAAYYANVGVDP